jgi:hypothetical protein
MAGSYAFSEVRFCLHKTVNQIGLSMNKNLIQPTISLEMPVPSQSHYGFYSFPVVD